MFSKIIELLETRTLGMGFQNLFNIPLTGDLTMKQLIMVLTMSLFISFYGCESNDKPTNPSEPPKYKLTLIKTGQGKCETIPEKAEYNSGEEVTIKAIADSGWEFIRWEGSTITSANPILVKMDKNLTISAYFEKLYLPSMNGRWFSDQWAIDLDLIQESNFSPIIRGTASLSTTLGNLTYKVTGNNIPPNIAMTWTQTGYYPIYINATWKDYAKFQGTLKENNDTYNITFLRGNSTPNFLNGIKYFPQRLQ